MNSCARRVLTIGCANSLQEIPSSFVERVMLKCPCGMKEINLLGTVTDEVNQCNPGKI